MWATGTPLSADTVDALDPATVAEVEEPANAMNAGQIVDFALDALDRYIAAIDPRETGT
jgi:hypothetical protein